MPGVFYHHGFKITRELGYLPADRGWCPNILVAPQEKQLIITLLSGIEIRHTDKFPEYKTRDVVELSEELCGKKKIQALLKPAPKAKRKPAVTKAKRS